MLANYSGYRALLVHAHPDDETINNGSTMALYAALGAQITLITCTRGEEGEVLVPDLAHLAAHETDALGDYRVEELAQAMSELGVADHRFLGEGVKRYRDSGMMGADANNRPDTFWSADFDEASQLLVSVIDEVKPHVMITYDEFGGYGHPDHIQAHRVAMAAAERAAWNIPKIYWNVMPKSVIQAGIEKMKSLGSDFFGADSADDLPFAKDDSFVHASIDGGDYVQQKMAAMAAHGTQIAVNGPFFSLSNNLGLEIWGNEYYTLVKGEKSGELDAHGHESDLFAGISITS
ncbi:MAG: N-acetyl-1-D-myo-inositol-2-amino-2-deoxy-alpha-D-glucopyranoside deacetylase [Actinobacteria bacterium]|nr:MAG: N-acetyl-1-D-myo-inositol-2-amino-2-deoxy-alpha-D-glucopyranoside deacetylase [Actinomycetota bacterium]